MQTVETMLLNGDLKTIRKGLTSILDSIQDFPKQDQLIILCVAFVLTCKARKRHPTEVYDNINGILKSYLPETKGFSEYIINQLNYK